MALSIDQIPNADVRFFTKTLERSKVVHRTFQTNKGLIPYLKNMPTRNPIVFKR